MALLDLDPDQLLSTTRTVRKRLDFARDVPDDLIRDCVRLALQAPSGGNNVTMRFVVVRDPERRRALGDLYRECWAVYRGSRGYLGNAVRPAGPAQEQQARVASSADHLGEHMGEAPVLVIACNTGEDRAAAERGMGNVMPGMWSFMLAARARGLGTAWTTVHRIKERDAAELLGIPYETVAQAVLSPVAFTRGTDFRPAVRPDPDDVIRWDRW
jgi:nitroreductase